MNMIEGIGDEVIWCAVVILLMILVLSVLYLWQSLTIESESSVFQPTSSEELQGTLNSSVGEENRLGCDITHDRNNISVTDAFDRMAEDGDRTAESNSSSENGEGVVIVENCSEMVKAEYNNAVESSRMSDSSCDENLYHHSDSPTVVRRTSTTPASSTTDVRNSSNVVRNEASAVSSVPTISETEQSYSDQIVIRIKYLNDVERTVSTRLSKIIADFKRDHFSEELAANKTVRLIFNGQFLQNEVTLQHYGVSDGCVVHVHISQTDPQRSATTIESNVDLDLSHLLWPLLFIILVLLWILYFKYPEFFNVTSTGILIIFTGVFIFAYGENRLQTRN